MRRFWLLIIVFCSVGKIAFSQPYLSQNGLFEVNQIAGCAGLAVTITMLPPHDVCTGLQHCSVNYIFNIDDVNGWGGLDVPGDYTHVYTNPGPYVIAVSSSSGGVDFIEITVFENRPPVVQVSECGNGVALSIPDINYDQYVIDYGDGTPIIVVNKGDPIAQHSYTPGMWMITVRGRNIGMADNCASTNRPVDIAPALPVPFIELLRTESENSIFLDFRNSTIKNNVLYRLEIAPNTSSFGAFQLLRTFYSRGDDLIIGLNTTSNYYCFRLGAYDPCNNTTTYSNVICSADFDVTAVNNANRLDWRTSSLDVSSYSFSRNPLPAATLSATPPQLTLDDTDIVCNTEYCYQMTTLYANGSRSISLTDCAVAISTQPPTTTENISIQVTGSTTLDLLWSQDPAFTASEYSVFKAGSAYGKSAQPEFTDNAFLLNAGECYAISYVDACGNQSARSAEACHINLSAALQTDNTVALSWNTYNGWLNGVDHYIVERYSSDGNLLSAVDAGANLTYTDTEPDPDNQVIVYRIVAYAVDGGVAESISNGATIIKQPNIYHPNTFTPNADGLNDTFQVISQYTAEVEFMVFNRWGEMLFYTTDLNVAWDGTYKGNTVPEGTYVFRCFLTDMSGVKYERSGNVVLLRKR